MPAPLVVRWTIGDVSPFGFETLRLSVWGAVKVFGRAATYVVCVNTVPLGLARARCGDLPGGVHFVDCTGLMDPFMARHLDRDLAQGVGWKFAPLRITEDAYELALDNDCILWDMPAAVERWLRARDLCVLAEDVRACFGSFADLCGPGPKNSGIRGIPPGLDLGTALASVLASRSLILRNEQDEQGLQVAALLKAGPVELVTLDEVAISSPFPPHLPEPGRCGVHFVGVNLKRTPFDVDGVPGEQLLQAHFRRLSPEVYARVGIEPAVESLQAAQG